MKRSVYPYIIAGAVYLCALLAVFFLLVLPGFYAGDGAPAQNLSSQPEYTVLGSDRLLTLALLDAELSAGSGPREKPPSSPLPHGSRHETARA